MTFFVRKYKINEKLSGKKGNFKNQKNIFNCLNTNSNKNNKFFESETKTPNTIFFGFYASVIMLDGDSNLERKCNRKCESENCHANIFAIFQN